MAELLGAGLELADLTPIRTQLELLDRYWAYRVIRSDRQGDARETVLRQTCEAMVKDRTLRVDRSRVVDSTGSQATRPTISPRSRLCRSVLIMTGGQVMPQGLPPILAQYSTGRSHRVHFLPQQRCTTVPTVMWLPQKPARLPRRIGYDADRVVVKIVRPSVKSGASRHTYVAEPAFLRRFAPKQMCSISLANPQI